MATTHFSTFTAEPSYLYSRELSLFEVAEHTGRGLPIGVRPLCDGRPRMCGTSQGARATSVVPYEYSQGVGMHDRVHDRQHEHRLPRSHSGPSLAGPPHLPPAAPYYPSHREQWPHLGTVGFDSHRKARDNNCVLRPVSVSELMGLDGGSSSDRGGGPMSSPGPSTDRLSPSAFAAHGTHSSPPHMDRDSGAQMASNKRAREEPKQASSAETVAAGASG
jgi:hypothetical protein